MRFLEDFFNGHFMPHGHCLLWRPELLLLHVGGDILTVLAYMSIPVALICLVKARKDLRFDRIFMMFAAFIFFCGLTHLLGIINVWHGYYYIHGVVKALTGIISVITAVMLWRLLPQIISLPGRSELRDKVAELQQAEARLALMNQSLEQQVAQRTAELAKMATTDELTGLLNRREIMRLLQQEMARAKRYNEPFSLLLIDIDFFKKINDSLGHLTGDKVLSETAATLQQALRSSDRIGRFGGEEFVVLLPVTADDAALDLAERLRKEVAGCCNAELAGQTLTVSIGVASLAANDDVSSLLNRADMALYQAKTAGRNQSSFIAADAS